MNAEPDFAGATRIFREIRERICTLDMPHGAILREAELAREFGVSRTPVRQALHQLAAFGLVETRNGVGTIVTAGDPGSLQETYDLRIELSGLIGHFAARPCPPEAAAEMRALEVRVMALRTKEEPRDFWQLNEERHGVVNRVIQNRELRALHDLYYYKVAPFWFSLFRADPAREYALLEREIQETAFWMEQGAMRSVANMHQNHIAMAADRLRLKAAR